jgi:hypothetical protein
VTLDKIISPSNYVFLYTSVGCISFFSFKYLLSALGFLYQFTCRIIVKLMFHNTPGS